MGQVPAGFVPDGFEADEGPNLKARGGDTINGRDPNAELGWAQRFVKGSLESMANPQSGLDFVGLGGLTSPITKTKLLPGAGWLMEKIGQKLEQIGIGTRPVGRTFGGADILTRGSGIGSGSLTEAAMIAGAPYAVQGAGKAVSATGRFLQRTEPLVKFAGPVERTVAESVPAVAESVGPATAGSSAARALSAEERQAVDALVQQGHAEADVLAELDKLRQPSGSKFTPSAVKLKMNAAETKEYLRLVKAGKPPEVAAELIKAQREFVTGKGLQDTATVKQRIRERNATGRWED